jgi:hypothetical protein
MAVSGVSSSNATASKGGDVNIIYMGQTSGPYSNDPFAETTQSRQKMTKDLKP